MEFTQVEFLALCPCLTNLTLEGNPICMTPCPDATAVSTCNDAIYTIILLMDTVSLPHLCLWRLFVVFTDRVLGRSLCEMS